MLCVFSAPLSINELMKNRESGMGGDSSQFLQECFMSDPVNLLLSRFWAYIFILNVIFTKILLNSSPSLVLSYENLFFFSSHYQMRQLIGNVKDQ